MNSIKVNGQSAIVNRETANVKGLPNFETRWLVVNGEW